VVLAKVSTVISDLIQVSVFGLHAVLEFHHEHGAILENDQVRPPTSRPWQFELKN